MIQGKNVIKRISAAVLSAVMFFSSLPGDVYASTNQSETVTDIISEETVEEDTYKVEISVTNVDNFTYAIVSSIDDAPEVASFKDANILNGKCLISNIPKDNYILVRTITAASGCTEPKMTVNGVEEKTTISIGSQPVEVWSSGKITEDITIGSVDSKKISVEAEGIKHQVNLSTENVTSIQYKTYTVNDSFLVEDSSGQVDLSNPSTNPSTIEVEDGKNLAITEITPVDGFSTPVVSVDGSKISSGEIGNTVDSTSLKGYNIGTIKENKEVSIVCTPNDEYTVEMNLENATNVTCVAYTQDESGTINVNFTKDATIVDNVATIKVPAGCYLAIKDIDFSYPEKGTVVKGGTPIYSTNFNFGEAYFIGQISGNISKDDTNKIVIKSVPPTTMCEVKVPVENIKSLQFVIYTDKNNITSDCIVDGNIVNEASKMYAKVYVAEGSFVAIKADSIKKADGDYLAPYVVQNGITKSEEIVGKYVATTTTDLKGYVLGKVASDDVANNINNSFKVIADHATYDVNITALCANQIKYKIFDNSDYSGAPYEETVDVTTIGQNKKGITIEVPTGKYLAITEIVGIDGCHGTESVTKGAEKLTKDSVGFKLGKITKDITEGITAEIIETAYDVTINIPYYIDAGTTKPVSVKYVVTSDINSVNTTTESINVTYDNNNNGKVTIKVDKSKYLVITDFVLGQNKAARTKIEFKKYAVDKNNNVSGEKETISYGKVGQYSSGTFLNGWNIGKVLNPMPLTDGQGAKTYVLDAKCFNYNMYLETKQSQNVSVTYTSGTTNEIISGKTRHYVKIKDKDEDINGISAEDVFLHIEEDGKPFTSNGVKAYAVNEYTSEESQEKVTLDGDGDGDGNYTLPADKIVEWTKAPEQFTKIVIVCEGNKNIIFPTVTESGVKIYAYVEGKKESDYGSLDDTSVLNNDDPKPIPYNSTFQFVAIPEDVTNFEVKSVTKEYGSAELISEKKTLADDSTVTCYTIQKITSDVKLNTLLMTKSTADVTYSVDNQSKGEATFTSSNSSKTDANKYKVQTGVDYVNFKVTVDKSIVPTVKCGEVDPSSYDEVKESGHSNLSTGKVEYSYKVLAKDIKGKTLIITAEQVLKDFYLQSKDNEINVIVSYNGKPIVEKDYKASDYNKGFTIHHYKVPYGKTINVRAIPLKNCKLTNATINYGTADVHNDKSVSYGTDGVIKYTVNDSNSMLGRDFVLGSKALTTLYVSDDYTPAKIDNGVFVDNNLIPITNNEGTFEIRKNLKTFRAAILNGSEAVAMDASNIRYEAKVGNTVVTNDIIVGVEDYKELDSDAETPTLKDPATKGLLKFDFEKASIAGKTVEVKIYRNNIVLGKLKFKVSPALETVSVGRNKNNSISQEYLSDKTYKLSYNSGVKAQDVAFTCEYYDIKGREWVRFQDTMYEEVNGVWTAKTDKPVDAPDGSDKLVTYDQPTNSIKISANKDTLQAMAAKAGYSAASGKTPGLPKIRINFYDVTDKDFDVTFNTYGGCDITKEITFTMSTLRGITPTASFLSASDTCLNIGLTAPKQYAKYKDSLYYVVKAEAYDRYNDKFPEDVLLPEKTVIVPMTEVAAKIDLAENGIVPGKGKAWKYNVTVAIGAYNKELVVSDPDGYKYFEHSKNKVINKVSTKEPYYETKIKASAKTNKIYQGQKNVQVATAVFDKKTTYYNLELRMYNKGTSLAEALADNTEPVACDNSVNVGAGSGKLSQDTNNPTRIIFDSTGIEPGEYVLYITPEAAGRGNDRTAYASSASVAITVYESINGLKKGGNGTKATFDVSVPSTSLYRKDKSTASMTAKAVFGNKPKSTKVTWKIKGVEGATTDITKFVSINSSGKITVSKNFKYETELDKSKNNQFIVYAVAADYTSDPKRSSVEKTVTIRPYTSQVTGLKLKKGNVDATHDADGKYASSEIDRIYAYGVNIKDCTVKSSNSKVIAVGDVNNDNTCKLVVKGAGKTRITVTSNDGGKSSKYIDVTIKNKSYEQLGLKIGGVLHDGDEYNNSSDLIIKDITVVDESGEGLEGITSYSLKVVSGGKLYAKGSHNYDLVPTATTTKLVLIDNTKNKKTVPSLYSQTIIINNNSIEIGKLKAGLTKTSYKPSEGGGILKVSGFPKDISTETIAGYRIALVADYADYTKNKARYDDFLSLEGNKLFNAPGDISMSSGLEYVAKYKMPVSDEKIKMPQGSEYGKAIGSYKFNAYILDTDSKIVAIVSLPTIQLKAADKPKFDLIGGYTVKKESGKTATIGLDVTKTQRSKVNAWKVVDVKDANIGGAINNKFSEYYEVNNGIIKAKSTVTDLDYNQNIYADVTYMYEDLAGKKYYVTKRIYVKATEY